MTEWRGSFLRVYKKGRIAGFSGLAQDNPYKITDGNWYQGGFKEGFIRAWSEGFKKGQTKRNKLLDKFNAQVEDHESPSHYTGAESMFNWLIKEGLLKQE